MKLQKILLAAITLVIVSSCVFDNDTADCPQGIDVHFYSQSPCAVEQSHPQLSGLTLFVFDKNGLLVSQHEATTNEMNAHHTMLSAKNGLYTVVAWGGLDAENFDRSALTPGVTTKSDLLFHIQRTDQQVTLPEGTKVYVGESSPVFLPDHEDYGSVTETAAVNLQEITNRLTIQIEGLPRTGDYEIRIESADGAMNIDGTIATDDIISYTSSTPVFDEEGVLQATLSMLKLMSGYSTTLIISDKKQAQELYRGDLLGTLLLKNPNVNLSCDHDFTIRFTAEDQCACGTYMMTEVWVNNWKLNSFNTDL